VPRVWLVLFLASLLNWSGVCFWHPTDMKNPEIGM